MHKEYKTIDELFRAEIGDITTPAPSFVKPNIDQALGFTKRRLGLLWMSLFALLVVGIAAGRYILAPKALVQHQKTTNEQEVTQLVTRTLSNGFAIRAAEVPTQQSAQDFNQTATHPRVIAQENSAQTQTQAQGSQTTGITRRSVQTSLKGSVDMNASTTPSTTLDETELTLNRTAANGFDRAIKTEQKHSEIKPNPTSLIDESQHDATKDSIVEQHENAALIEQKEDEKKPNLQEDPYALITPLDTTAKNPVKPWMASLTGGPNFVRTSYTAVNANDKTIYDNGTEDQFGSQFNADVTYRFRQGLAIGTGIGWLNFNEKFDFETNSIELDSFEHKEIVFDSLTMENDTVTSWTFEEVAHVKKHTGSNKATYISVPIQLGAQLVWGKVQLDIFSSIRFNILARSFGGYLQDHVFYEFESGTTIYKPFYIDLLFGSRLHYRFWKTFYATASVNYRPVFGQVYTTTSFNKSYDYVHLGLGISYRF